MLKKDLNLTTPHNNTPAWSRSGSAYVPFLRFVLIAFLLLGVGAVKATNKLNWENQYLQLEKSDFPLYLSELRQKFSPAATQCGTLVSFGANSPNNGARYAANGERLMAKELTSKQVKELTSCLSVIADVAQRRSAISVHREPCTAYRFSGQGNDKTKKNIN